MKAAAVTGALAVSGHLLKGGAEAATPPVDKDLDGVIEMHVHADPGGPSSISLTARKEAPNGTPLLLGTRVSTPQAPRVRSPPSS